MSDLISRADAIDALRMCVVESELLADWNKAMESAQELLSALPSADAIPIVDLTDGKTKLKAEDWVYDATPSAEAEPTVIRCKTMIPYGDFREWAKRIREDNPNVIVIPFDAEVVSADAVEVVRCKDCKHKYVSGNGTTQYYVCDFMDAQYEDDGFCHHGESEVEE